MKRVVIGGRVMSRCRDRCRSQIRPSIICREVNGPMTTVCKSMRTPLLIIVDIMPTYRTYFLAVHKLVYHASNVFMITLSSPTFLVHH